MRWRLERAAPLLVLAVTLGVAFGESVVPDRAALEREIKLERDVTYGNAQGVALTLDIYLPRDRPTLRPVLFYIHGGGWMSRSKTDAIPELAPGTAASPVGMLPYLRRGAAVVSVGYRLAQVAPAPAAVEDCLRALRWVTRHGPQHGLDPKRLAVIGPSAGGHLALMVALTHPDRRFAVPAELRNVRPRVAGAIDLWGITDVLDVLEGPNSRPWAQQWIPEGAGRADRARRVSPLTHVRRGVPPVLVVHSERDTIVPYSHSTRLRDALSSAGASVELVTVPGTGHGFFTADQLAMIEKRITTFLEQIGVLDRP